MLQIGVHHNDIIRVGMLQSGVHRRLLAEVAREGDVFDVVKLRGKSFHNQIGFVLAAVVDKNIAEPVIGNGRNHLVGFRDKMFKTRFFIVAGYNQINRFHIFYYPFGGSVCSVIGHTFHNYLLYQTDTEKSNYFQKIQKLFRINSLPYGKNVIK